MDEATGPSRNFARTGLRRELAAIVFADLVGYSAMMNRDEARALRVIRTARARFFEPLAAAYNGAIVKDMGDGLLLKFASLVEAVGFGIAVQKGLAESSFDEGDRPVFRLGATFGDIVVDKGDVFGDGVNMAARLQPLAPPGGLCLSAGAYNEIRNHVAAPFESGGFHTLKGAPAPVEIFLLAPEGVARTPPPPATGRSLSRRWPFGFVAIVACLGAAVWIFHENLFPPPLNERLQVLLADALPSTTVHARNRLIRDYLALDGHRAIALAPQARERWWTGDWNSRAEAEEKALERCQLAYGETCAVIAADDETLKPGRDGVWPTRAMARLSYGGTFDPQMIPGVRASKSRRSEMDNYPAATGPKAAAIQARGVLYLVTGVVSQRLAEEQALKRCKDDPERNEVTGPCYLYAAGNQVVLPLRLSAPQSDR